MDLASRVHAVYHCAARVSSAVPYESMIAVDSVDLIAVLCGPNVVGTKRIISFCATSVKKHLHYISTLSALNRFTVRPFARVILTLGNKRGLSRDNGGALFYGWVRTEQKSSRDLGAKCRKARTEYHYI